MVKEGRDLSSFLLLLQENNICSNSYLSYEYYSVLIKYRKPKRFLYFSVEKLNQTIGILPLERSKIGYTILGYRYSNYLGYICKECDTEEVDREITEYLSTKRKNILINYYDINTNYKLYSLLQNERFAKSLYLYECPFCQITDGFNSFFQKAIPSSKKRAELRKFERKLNALGKIEVIHIDTLELWEKWKHLFSSLVAIHAERFYGVYIPQDLCLHKNAEYYYDMFESLIAEKRAFLSIMLLEGETISFLYAVVSDSIIMDWMPAFDPAFSKYSLGTVHLMKIFQYVCGNDRYKIFDFSKGGGVYKYRWADEKTDNYAFVRRFSQSPIAIVQQVILYNSLLFKSYLRKKGILNRIKKILSFIKTPKKKLDDKGVEIIYYDSLDFVPIIKTPENQILPFRYSIIKDLSIENKKLILDMIYVGRKILIEVDINRTKRIYVDHVSDSTVGSSGLDT